MCVTVELVARYVTSVEVKEDTFADVDLVKEGLTVFLPAISTGKLSKYAHAVQLCTRMFDEIEIIYNGPSVTSIVHLDM